MIVGKDYIGIGVGALIFNEEHKVLLSLRGPLAKNEQGTWEIPGGGVEFGETLVDALKREIMEEIGVEIEVMRMLHIADHILEEEGQHWVSPTFICKIVRGTPQIKEPGKCERLEWFSVEDATQLPLSKVTQDDITVLKKLTIPHILSVVHGVDQINLPIA